jgi:hypothetical protein
MNYEELTDAILKECPRLNRSMFSKGSCDSIKIEYADEIAGYTMVECYLPGNGAIHVTLPYISGGTYYSDPCRVYMSYTRRITNALNKYFDLLDAHKVKHVQEEGERLLRVKNLKESVVDRLSAIHGDHFTVSDDGYRCNFQYLGYAIPVEDDKASLYLGNRRALVPLQLVMTLIQTVATNNLIEGI